MNYRLCFFGGPPDGLTEDSADGGVQFLTRTDPSMGPEWHALYEYTESRQSGDVTERLFRYVRTTKHKQPNA